MKKQYTIRWTKEASDSYVETLDFILIKWTMKEVVKFETIVDELLVNLSFNLKLCPEVKARSVRKCTLSAQTSVVYRIVAKSVELIAFVDNRSDHSY